ncbi:alpha/beta hydrolase family protein [Wenzhouxiangella marina]|uniref:Secreted dipeptidyl aminopeptidase n=1 Tax=Wenzhouxiangella marina TaxID=1579979 RepID=A0A0K0XVX6_9GAMM|nr:S9 family peptidase [Wenzhouxiangella marina]AKS41777.1 Secreted dipeptidyl aminopeptidase [Wenzhouxiangella marina]MBB6086461.1 dipeptidyl aminopeptidase/acylaminoacyl peptidase [Wenzhouxiangella marina]
MSLRSKLIALGLMIVLSGSLIADTIPTRAFFDSAKVTNMKIAPDGEHVAFTYEEGSEVRLAVLNLDSSQITASFEFGDNQHVFNFWWGNNERVLMSVGEVTGNLDNLGRPAHLYAADVDGRRRQQIFEMVSSSYQILHTLPDDREHVLIARRHWGDGGSPKANLLDIYNGEMRYLPDQPMSNDIVAIIPDNSGEIRLAAEVIQGDTFDDRQLNLFIKHAENDWRRLRLESVRQPVSINLIGFSADNEQAYFLSNHDMAANDRLGVFRYDFGSNEIELLHRDARVNVSGTITGHDGEVLGVTADFGPRSYTFFGDLAETHRDAILLQRLVLSFPEQNVALTSFTQDGRLAVAWVWGDRNPGEFFLFDTESLQARFLAARLPELPKDALVPMEPVTIEARDGLSLNALLTRPADQRENLPLIVNVHGGPFGIYDRWGYQPEAQYFAQHGYATLQVNYRGSGNRGDDFQNAGRREWGGKMQDDVTDATRWAIEQGIADPDRICIYGGSYGGYATLMGVVKEPELYACGVGYVGVYDLVWFREGDGNDWSRQQGRGSRQARERWFDAWVGPDPDALEPYSPVHNVDRIEAELFIVHGGSDVRVVVGHAERLRDALDEIGKSYEWLIKEEEGHGFYNVDNRVELYERMLSFFNRHIGEPSAEVASN